MVALTHWLCFLFFLIIRTVDVLAPSQVKCWWLFCMDRFPAYWRQANVTLIPKGPLFFSVTHCRLISITSILSKELERLVSVRLGRFMERTGVLPTTKFAYRKDPGSCDVLSCMSHTLQSALESRKEGRIVKIDFIAASDSINWGNSLQAPLCGYRMFCVLSNQSAFYVLSAQFLSNWS